MVLKCIVVLSMLCIVNLVFPVLCALIKIIRSNWRKKTDSRQLADSVSQNISCDISNVNNRLYIWKSSKLKVNWPVPYTSSKISYINFRKPTFDILIRRRKIRYQVLVSFILKFIFRYLRTQFCDYLVCSIFHLVHSWY